ncbi:MAG: hypothetical protein HY043_06450 [Verrucomicrobia bacterium]|nr:hypothetical protein [Verrucomicrobiota bacterium]
MNLRQQNSLRATAAFTLLEVVIALGIFSIAMFAILDLTGQSLRAARALRQTTVTASTLAAELCLTNRLEEGVESGDFGDIYPGYTWTREIYLWPTAPTNGMFQVDFTVYANSHRKSRVESKMSILLFRPESTQRRAGAPR